MKGVFVKILSTLLIGSFAQLSAQEIGAMPDLCKRHSYELEVKITKGPYLSCVTQNSIIVSWHTDIACPSIVNYGETSDYGLTVEDTVATTAHSLKLTDLLPSTLYHYQVVYGDTATGDFTFRTAVTFDEPFRFVAYGDCRTGHYDHIDVVNRIIALDPYFVLNTGDLVENGYSETDWRNYFLVISSLTSFSQNYPIYSALGNHENESPLYYNYFYLPHNNPDSTEAYYSFDYGNSHFICLDTEIPYTVGSKQYTWLEQDLQAASSTATFIFVFFHKPPYSSGAVHGSNISVRNTLCPLFEQYGVDMVFNGHDHIYERTIPINGVTYVVTGGGGAPLYNVGTSSWTAYSEKTYHCCLITVDANSFFLEMVRKDGTIGDTCRVFVTGVEERTVAAKEASRILLLQNYPNPFVGKTSIQYAVASRKREDKHLVTGHYLPITLKIYDLNGRLVRTLVDELQNTGYYTVYWNGKDDNGQDVTNGIYFCRLAAGKLSLTRKMTLMR